jgi:hypothetical protein
MRITIIGSALVAAAEFAALVEGVLDVRFRSIGSWFGYRFDDCA